MNYLLKAKFLIGMTELKLTKTLKKKIFGLMKGSSQINEDNIQFIDSKYDEFVDDSDRVWLIYFIQNYNFFIFKK